MPHSRPFCTSAAPVNKRFRAGLGLARSARSFWSSCSRNLPVTPACTSCVACSSCGSHLISEKFLATNWAVTTLLRQLIRRFGDAASFVIRFVASGTTKTVGLAQGAGQ